jgi:TolB-like protein
MPSRMPGYEYDIFISYRQKDNKYDGWVTDFVKNLKGELEATLKDNVSIYFDENPEDGILESHLVDQTIFLKIKSLIFIPILSQTYCDPESFAWRNELQPFLRMAAVDRFGRDLRVKNGNIASRVLFVRIHELDHSDQLSIEKETGTSLRSIDFIYKAPGVNRPLRSNEEIIGNTSSSISYRDQINKVANAVKELITQMIHFENQSVAADQRKPEPELAAPEKSIAVLPFLNMSKDPSQEYFADGITENILTELASVPDLKVISRTSVMRYKNTLKSIREIAEELNVSYVLEGSAQTYLSKVRINAQLIEARQDKHIWAKAFDQELKDIFQIQTLVAQRVVEQLKLTINQPDKRSAQNIPTDNLEAYDLFLKGRHSQNLYTLEGFRLSERYFKMALKEDPEYIPAYSGLAKTYIHLASWMGDMGPDEALKEAATVLKRVAVQKRSAMDYLTQGWMDLLIRKDYASAEEYLSRAVQMDPGDAGLQYGYSYLLCMVGRFDEAWQVILKARTLDPVSVPAFNYTGVTYYLMRKYAEARTTFSECIRMHPLAIREYDHMAKVFLANGEYDQVEPVINAGLLLTSLRPPSMLCYLSAAYNFSGNYERSNKLLQELIERSLRGEKGINVYLAQYYAISNNITEAYHWLEKAVQTNDVDLFWLKVDPLFDNLRDDSRYKDYLIRCGF